MQGSNFLVRVNNTYFLQSSDGREILVTDTPSHALHLSYRDADGWCQRLRRRRYPQAIITDIAGNVMTYEAIKLALASQAEQVQDPLPTSREELDRIPAAQYRKRLQDPAFRARAAELEDQPRAGAKTRR
jgi:hypothetical protein